MPLRCRLFIENRITPLGKTLRHPVDVLLEWADAYMPEIERARRVFDVESPTTSQA